jgi:two-component system cell cycle sensor histidine kinase/response regulator CckA
VLQPIPLCLNALINDMGKMLTRLLGESIKIEYVLEPNLSFIKADPGQIEQVVLNLVVNARDAMLGGGHVHIETSNESPPGTDGHPPKGWVRLTVRDNGMGMTEDVKAHIFEPFFTTKSVGKGTGLGMSTVFGIVQQSGGRIEFDTTLGKGTAFHIFLPTTTEVAPPVLPAGGALPAGRGETILVVEDDPNIRLFLRRVLEIGGYSILEAAGPEAAFIVMTSGGTHVDLLLTDVVMPAMNGRVLAEKLSRFQNGLRVVFISGHTEDALLLSGIRSKDIPFLAKPFSPEALLRKLREVLDAKETNTASDTSA